MIAALRWSALFVFAFGCARSDRVVGDGGTGSVGGGDDGGGVSEESACLLHNCTEDAHCTGCSEGRTTCLTSEGRCVACGPDGGCPSGQVCSSWGNCVPEGLECPTDIHGDPTISCSSNADCAACDPMHLVCDVSTQSCVACTPGDTSGCQPTDICVDGQCSGVCPSSCDADADCSQCGGVGFEAHACHEHHCAECSPTFPCPSGEVCNAQGVCEVPCGTDGTGDCSEDADCAGCGIADPACHVPIGSDRGTCGPAADGCSDLGDGTVVLPSPWSQYTNTCSDEGDCEGVGATVNVGELLRDLTGIDAIGDANVTYPMNECASVSLGEIACGVCVPCKEDVDCEPISIDAITEDAFGPIGSVAAALLLNQIFGQEEHNIHMYCQTVAGGYGVCAPCPGVIYECGSSGGGGGGGSGVCDHDPCVEGGPLDGECDACAAEVCALDSFCCENQWDNLCADQATTVCNLPCEDDPGPTCHDECQEGLPLDPTCSACVADICDYDPFCCDDEWDSVCVGYVDERCSPPCG